MHSIAKKPAKSSNHHSKNKADSLEELNQQIKELTEALQRERADAVNLRRRTEEERAQLANYYKALVIKQLLPVIDNLGRARQHVPKELADNDYVKGVQGILKQFEDSLKNLGVERIKTVGEIFDPHFHEAVSFEEGQGKKEIVSEELQGGYKLGDEVIRHAIVKVHLQ